MSAEATFVVTNREVVDVLRELIAVMRAGPIPLRDRWLDAAGVGALLCQNPEYVTERLSSRPDFPRPMCEGRPRWKASEIIDWADRVRDERFKRRERASRN